MCSSEYEYRHGPIAVNLAVEALSEGMAYHLSLALGEELGIPNYKEIVKRNRELLIRPGGKSMYADVDNAIRWIERNGGFPHGVQKAWNMYMDNIAHFMSEIRK